MIPLCVFVFFFSFMESLQPLELGRLTGELKVGTDLVVELGGR